MKRNVEDSIIYINKKEINYIAQDKIILKKINDIEPNWYYIVDLVFIVQLIRKHNKIAFGPHYLQK